MYYKLASCNKYSTSHQLHFNYAKDYLNFLIIEFVTAVWFSVYKRLKYIRRNTFNHSSCLCQGLEASWSKHKKNAELLWEGLEKLGLELLVKDKVGPSD